MNTQATPTDILNEAFRHLVEIGVERPVVSSTYHGILSLQFMCHGLAVKSGWWDNVSRVDKNVIGTKLCLIHSEISEALEGVRKDTMDPHLTHRQGVEVELADAVIRIFDLAGGLDLDLAGALLEKLSYNQKRDDHKPANRAAPGGKKV